MIRVLIVCVNYNSYKELHNYLLSIDRAASTICGTLHTDVIVADNSTEREKVDTTAFSYINVRQVLLDNLGYLGGAQSIINSIVTIQQYAYVIVSNVDLVFDKDTLKQLLHYNLGEDVAWVAPTIYSEKYQKDLNPNVLYRYKSWKLKLLKLTYNKHIYHLYDSLYYSRKSTKKKHHCYSEMCIYAGHGSCIILTSSFFKQYNQIHYPIFLYGEELFLAEMILKKGMKVMYVPSVKVITTGGVSTSKMPSKRFFQYNIEAINYLLKSFY